VLSNLALSLRPLWRKIAVLDTSGARASGDVVSFNWPKLVSELEEELGSLQARCRRD